MADEDRYCVQVLKTLEAHLIGEGFRPQAERIAALVKRLKETGDPDAVLRQLYGVRGWDTIALRLLWYEYKARETDVQALERTMMDKHMRELFDAVVKTGGVSTAPPPQSPAPSVPTSQDITEALERFDAAVGILKQRSLQGDDFIGIEQPLIEILQEETDALRGVASAEDNQDIVKFCTALSIFLVYIIDKGRTNDVRTMNIIDNANLTLQTVQQTMGAADYDSLQQITQLLENPGTLME